MSYRRHLSRRHALAGITSQPPGRAVSAYALGSTAGRKGGRSTSGTSRVMWNAGQWLSGLSGITSQPPGRAVSAYALGSLGDDAPTSDLSTPTLAQPTVTDPATVAYQQASLANQQTMIKQLQGDHLQKWVQIAVTASIPLFGAIWKLIFGAGRD